MKLDWKFCVYFSLAVIETVIIFWYSFIPAVDFVETGFLRLGDLEHIIAYAVYGFLLQRVFGYFFGKKESFVLSVLVASSVGWISEGMQHFLPYRTGDVIDWGLDTAGSFIGGFLSSRFKPYSQIDKRLK